MAADARLFEPQRRAFPGLVVPDWAEPEAREPLREYAARMARSLGSLSPALVGGTSFGGLVAIELAACLGLPSCLLISSVRSPDEMPWRLRALRPLARLGPERLGVAAGWASQRSAPSVGQAIARRLARLSLSGASFLRWACWATLDWSPSPGARRLRAWQIHGSVDRTFPVQCTRPDAIIRGGGHLLPLTHSGEVNAFLADVASRRA
jgi:pimeloyl-ACP methyl ester carboxylesterase